MQERGKECKHKIKSALIRTKSITSINVFFDAMRKGLLKEADGSRALGF